VHPEEQRDFSLITGKKSMPIQFEWQPNTQPIPKGTDTGLLILGDDDKLPADSNGRVRLVELPATGKQAGVSEAAERTIATFHGKIHRDPSAKPAERITFDILRKQTDLPHTGDVFGFDPECMFGVDFFQLTFVNRQFVIWFPFHTDVRSEGDFLEIQAIAEVADSSASGGFRVLARSMTRTLTNREKGARTVTTTSTSVQGGAKLRYTGKLAGFNIGVQEDYLLPVGIRNAAQSTKEEIVLDPGIIPADASVRFAAYPANAMRIILMTDLLDGLAPDQQFARNVFPSQNPDVVSSTGRQELRSVIPQRIVEIFLDAGFQGATAIFQDDPAAAQLVQGFNQRFTNRSGAFQLRDPNQPLATSFWNFFIASNSTLGVAARSERLAPAQIRATINEKEVFLNNAVPIGAGDKNLREPVGIAAAVFRKLVTDDPGTGGFRQFESMDKMKIACQVMGRKVAATVAHEVAHSLGMMHTARLQTAPDASESSGAPVLTVTSEDLRGYIGPTIRFSMQAKVIWSKVFGVSPVFNDNSLQNKTWKTSEVPTMDWNERKKKFRENNGELRLVFPGGLGTTGVPPFAVNPPGSQRGTR
jgi:hypothetical protein